MDTTDDETDVEAVVQGRETNYNNLVFVKLPNCADPVIPVKRDRQRSCYSNLRSSGASTDYGPDGKSFTRHSKENSIFSAIEFLTDSDKGDYSCNNGKVEENKKKCGGKRDDAMSESGVKEWSRPAVHSPARRKTQSTSGILFAGPEAKEDDSFTRLEDDPEWLIRTWLASLEESMTDAEKVEKLSSTFIEEVAYAMHVDNKKLTIKWNEVLEKCKEEAENYEINQIIDKSLAVRCSTPKFKHNRISPLRGEQRNGTPSRQDDINDVKKRAFSASNATKLRCKRLLEKKGVIDLSFSPASDVDQVVAAIRDARVIYKFIWKGCDLEDECIVKITDALSHVPGQMDLLDFSGNPNLGQKAAEAIAKLIRVKKVKRINVKRCGLEKYHEDVLLPAMQELPKGNGLKIEYAVREVNLTVDSRGGEIHAKQSRYSVFFPADAVRCPTEITFRIRIPKGNFPNGLIPVSPILKCSSSTGLEFDVPVKIQLPIWVYPNSEKSDFNLIILTRHCKEVEWERQSTVPFGEQGVVEFTINHFSDVAAAIEEEILPRANVNFYNMLFINERQSQQEVLVTSCYVPNNRDAICESRIDLEDAGATMFGGGHRLQINADDQMLDLIRLSEEEDNRLISIRPRHGYGFVAENITRNGEKKMNYTVELREPRRQEPRRDGDARTARLFHTVIRNGDGNNTPPEFSDPFNVTWTNETRPPTIIQRISNQYNIAGCLLLNVEGPDQIIGAVAPPNPQGVQQPVEPLHAPHEEPD